MNNKNANRIENDGELPGEIALIYIHNIPGIDFVEWTNPTSGFIPSLTIDKLSSKIKEKEIY